MPCNAIKNFIAQFRHGLSNRKNIVKCSGNPNCTIICELFTTQRKPLLIKIIIFFKALRLILIAFVYGNLLP